METDPTIKVTIWNEGRHEKLHPDVAQVYPGGIHGAIAEGLKYEGLTIRCGNLDDPDEGLGEEILNDTDVLLWWGHIAHAEVSDVLIDRIQQRVLKGMGLVVLHSGHHSKLFRRLMGTNCNLAWRGLPQRMHLPAWSGSDFLFWTGTRNLSDLSQPSCSSCYRQRDPLGKATAY